MESDDIVEGVYYIRELRDARCSAGELKEAGLRAGDLPPPLLHSTLQEIREQLNSW